jgi:hypothetical protein
VCNTNSLCGTTVLLPDGESGIIIRSYYDAMNPEIPYIVVQPYGSCGELLTLKLDEISR